MKKYIVSNPKIMGGIPTIAGTRVPIARIVSLLREGHTIKEVNQMFPWVGLHKLESALSELESKLSGNNETQTVLQT